MINVPDTGCEANMKEGEETDLSDMNCIVDGHRFGEFGECLVCGHITNDENFDSMFETTEDLFNEFLDE